MGVSTFLAILKHFGPGTWFAGIVKDADRHPATVAGLLFVWITIVGGGFMAYMEIAQANDKIEQMSNIVARNTVALDCARLDRQISAKTREIQHVNTLMDVATSDVDKRLLDQELQAHQTKLRRLETAYDNKCIDEV